MLQWGEGLILGKETHGPSNILLKTEKREKVGSFVGKELLWLKETERNTPNRCLLLGRVREFFFTTDRLTLPFLTIRKG